MRKKFSMAVLITIITASISAPLIIFNISPSINVQYFSIKSEYTAGGSINPLGNITIEAGEHQEFFIIADESHLIVDVIINGTSFGPINFFNFTNIQSNQTIEAIFSKKTFTIDIISNSNGTTIPSQSEILEYGDDKKITFLPDDGFHIAEVLIDGSSIGNLSEYTFSNITSNHTVEAFFEINLYSIEVSYEGNGTIIPTQFEILEYGDNKNIIFLPDYGFHISDVLIDDSSIGSLSEFAFNNITSNHTVEVFFEINLYSISVSHQGDGSIIPGSINTIKHGTSQNFQINPAEGNHIEDVKINDISIGAVESYMFNNITINQTIHTVFEINKYQINATSDINGSISSPGITSIEYDENITYYFYPNTNFTVQNVTVDGIVLGSLTNYTFKNINSNHLIRVAFVSTVQKYALIIGISDYKTVTDLNYCDEDANAWYSYFTSKNYIIWVLGDNSNSYSQFNGTATEKNINETIQKIISLADYNDEVALTFSGHGDGDGNGYSYLFAWDASSGEGGYDGYIDDFELSDYLSDLRADKLFIFLDACNSGGMNETMDNPSINHIFMTTTSTENGLGWDVPAFQLGAWTHFFLIEGLNNTDHENWNFTSVFLYAYDEYHTFYGDGGTWDGPTRWDHPVYYNSDENNPFIL